MGVLVGFDNLADESSDNQQQFTITNLPMQSIDCNRDILTIMEQIALTCEALGQNEVCYGNRQIEVTPNNERIPLEFFAPGDLLPINQVQSLRLSTFDIENELWGVAQIRLLLADFRNVQDIQILLFGDVYVEDSADERMTMNVIVQSSAPINLRTQPDLNGLVVTTAQPNRELLAVARTVDGAWIQVEDPDMGYLAWVFSELVSVSDTSQSLNDLLITDGTDEYWRPMQAFMFESGQAVSCDNSPTDGMLIQSADGMSRITFLINEVVVELLPGHNNQHASAFVQSNVANGMNINVIEGRAEVTVHGVMYEVLPDTALNIPLTLEGIPSGTASTQASSSAIVSDWLNTVVETQVEWLINPTQPPIYYTVPPETVGDNNNNGDNGNGNNGDNGNGNNGDNGNGNGNNGNGNGNNGDNGNGNGNNGNGNGNNGNGNGNN